MFISGDKSIQVPVEWTITETIKNIKQCKTYTWVTRGGGAKYSPKNSPNYSPVISGNLVTSIGNIHNIVTKIAIKNKSNSTD